MTKTGKILSSALIGPGTSALTTANAPAAIVCNSAGERWHTHHSYHYGPNGVSRFTPTIGVGGPEIAMFGANTRAVAIGATASGCGSEPPKNVGDRGAA